MRLQVGANVKVKTLKTASKRALAGAATGAETEKFQAVTELRVAHFRENRFLTADFAYGDRLHAATGGASDVVMVRTIARLQFVSRHAIVEVDSGEETGADKSIQTAVNRDQIDLCILARFLKAFEEIFGRERGVVLKHDLKQNLARTGDSKTLLLQLTHNGFKRGRSVVVVTAAQG